MITLKLLRVTFDHVSAALGSVEVGVEDLMHELAEQMCDPMVEYVKCLKTEMTTGTCSSLLATVEEMAGVMRDVRLELEDARKKVRIAENRKIEALSRLAESEERVRRMKENLGFLLEAKNGFMEHTVPHKFLGTEEGQGKDEKPLWQLLKKKRKYQTPDSPLGAEGLLYSQPNNKHYKSTRARPSTTHRPVTRSFSRGLGPQTPCLDSWLSLGSSPSAVNQQVLSRQHSYSLNSCFNLRDGKIITFINSQAALAQREPTKAKVTANPTLNTLPILQHFELMIIICKSFFRSHKRKVQTLNPLKPYPIQNPPQL
ncbi:hypothetical protein L1049_028232 [Liquidambar formosana]|uniref:Uncharacterized protein n=1 Tax=Liquidambar formosana TaxID=63359 RepID=A0AAP0RK32_LIQFO